MFSIKYFIVFFFWGQYNGQHIKVCAQLYGKCNIILFDDTQQVLAKWEEGRIGIFACHNLTRWMVKVV